MGPQRQRYLTSGHRPEPLGMGNERPFIESCLACAYGGRISWHGQSVG